MTRGADNRRASAVALLPVAVAVAAVLALALIVKGNERGTIVVQRVAISARAVQSGKRNPPVAYSVTEIVETAADGSEERTFTSETFSHPGLQQVTAGQHVQLYDARDNTIFVTTQPAIQRALRAEMGAAGDDVGVHQVSLRSRLVFSPGRQSVFAQQLHARQYRIAARTTTGGRPALEIVQTHPTRLHGFSVTGGYRSLTTAYVSPRTYDPIEEITHMSLPGVTDTVVERWTEYRVLSSTTGNERLLSLTALHPHARIVDGARAFLQATQSEQRPMRLKIRKGQVRLPSRGS